MRKKILATLLFFAVLSTVASQDFPGLPPDPVIDIDLNSLQMENLSELNSLFGIENSSSSNESSNQTEILLKGLEEQFNELDALIPSEIVVNETAEEKGQGNICIGTYLILLLILGIGISAYMWLQAHKKERKGGV